MYAVGDGTEVLAVETAFENALDTALNMTSGTVEHLGRQWQGRGSQTTDTLVVYEFDPEERDSFDRYERALL